MEWWKFVLLIVGSYLVGNIFFARIISRVKHYDIEAKGSGNPGTMNMLRNLGFRTGLLTLALDMLKGAVPAICGYYLFGGASGGVNSYIGLFLGSFSSLVGTVFPVFYKFKGGKGAATVYGMFCVANPTLGAIIFIGGIIFLFLFDYASLVSFFMITIFTIFESVRLTTLYGPNLAISALLFLIFALVFFAHRANIFRLLTGKENKVNFIKSFKTHKQNKLTKDEKQEIIEKEIG